MSELWQVEYKNSFVEVRDVATLDEVKRRAFSLPPRLKAVGDEDDEDRGQEKMSEYMMSLQRRMERHASCEGMQKSSAVQQWSPEHHHDTLEKVSVSGSAQSTDADNDDTSSSTSSSTRTKLEDFCKKCGGIFSTSHVAKFCGYCGQKRDDRLEPAAELFRTRVSIGAAGHPEFCSRPCIFFVQGRCENGSECNYCHLEHTQRPYHLDKTHRELLKSQPRASILCTTISILHERMDKIIEQAVPSARPELITLKQNLQAVLETALAKEMTANPRASRFTMKRNPKLQHAFSKLTASNILKYAAGSEDKETEDAIFSFRKRLREVMA
eukprot:TRINITY_DN42398_c0_g1_i1.p1 TRINITY_DN42398_c0_g1~~TRINITY_DN42398_c0_g1_i1.p1  ORF type:complete len:326 (-),score=60.70 TRINITY_DN42398_c0_g1_i1:92-1069(-)